MIIRIVTHVYMEVKDEDQAEQASMTLEQGIEPALGSFPRNSGLLVQADVDHYDKLTDKEIADLGFED